MKSMTRMVIISGIILISSGPVSGFDGHESGMAYKFDLDHDGVITRAEFDEAFEKKMKNKLTWLDTNKDGVISPEEFRSQHEGEYDQRWSMWDADGDGVVSVEAVIQQQQESRGGKKRAMQQKD